MIDKKIIGFLVLVVLTASIYVMLPGSVRLDVGETYSTFKVFEEGKWEISGTERTILMDGTKIMRASKRIVNFAIEGNLTKIYRYAYFKNGVIAKDTYEFRGDIKDVELFPIEHKTEIWNGEKYFFRYEVRDLIYNGETYKLSGETLLSFGRNMKLELHPDYRWGWVYKSGIVRVQYDINSDYEVFYNRLFDPTYYNIFDNFDDGNLGANWTIYSSDGARGRVTVRDNASYSGSYSVIMDTNLNGNFQLNELITNYDFSKARDIYLSFWHREFGADSETAGIDHSGHYNSDAYYFTCDGSYWYHIGDLGDVNDTWTKLEYNISLDSDYCSEINSSFKIKFTQYNGWTIPYNGRAFDDINISYNTLGINESEIILTLDLVESDRYYELGTVCELKAEVLNSTGDLIYNSSGNNICLNIDQVDFGDDFICGNGSVSYNLTTNAVKNSFNDSSLSKNLTYTNATENKTFYIEFNRYDDIQNAYIDLTGFENTSYPLNTKIYVNDTKIYDLSYCKLEGNNQITYKLSNTNETENLTYTTKSIKIKYLKLHKTANITSAYLNISGFEVWDENSSIVEGLVDMGEYSSLIIFEKDNLWHIILSEFYGNNFKGYIWNETNSSWYENSSIVEGLANCIHGGGYKPKLEIFEKDNLWQIISIGNMAQKKGCIWNETNSSWYENSSIVLGLGNLYSGDSEIFYKDSIWHLIAGELGGNFYGYQWNGTSWVSNSSLILGLGDIGSHASPTIFYKDSIWHLIAGTSVDGYKGFQWNGTKWVENQDLIFNLIFHHWASPNMYQKDGIWYISLGERHGFYYGFQYFFPINPYIDVANSGGVREWSYGSKLNISETANLNSTLINTYLSSCTADSEGYCNVPILFYSGSAGILEISNINITNSNQIINLTTSAINDYLASQSSGFHNIPIRISSETNTIIQVDNINITYYGSDNISVTAHFEGDGTYSASNSTKIIKVVHSNFNISLPNDYPIDELIWDPISSSSKNITPWGQSDSTAGWNLTSIFYHGLNVNVSIKVNESFPSCMNMTVDDDNNKTGGSILNTTYQQIISGFNTLLNTKGIWWWWDGQSCNRSAMSYIYRDYDIIGCCEDCVCKT